MGAGGFVAGERTISAPSGNRTVLLAMLVSFGTFALAGPVGVAKLGRLGQYVQTGGSVSAPLTGPALKSVIGSHSKGTPTPSIWTVQSIFGWVFVFVMLTVLADFDATSDLAASFAMLIMVSTLLALGPDALNNITHLTEKPTS